MKDWKAAARNWARRDKGNGNGNGTAEPKRQRETEPEWVKFGFESEDAWKLWNKRKFDEEMKRYAG